MKLLIVLRHSFDLWNAPSWFSHKLREDFPGIEVVHISSYEGIENYIGDAEVVITWSLRPEQFKAAKRVRWIHSPAAAVHQLMFPELVNSDVVLTNSREIHGPVVAEHVIALVFALAKRLPQAVRLQKDHLWGQQAMWDSQPRPREVAGATLGLVGLGSIGREVAKRAAALGMRVIAVREYPEKGRAEAVEEVFAPSQLRSLLARSDFVVLALPLTPFTTAVIDASRLAQMKPDACLINVGRGPLVDEAALAAALGKMNIGGAALDVFSEEPLPKDSPLWNLENLIITPHTAALTDKLWERHYLLISENLRRYIRGEALLAVVDKKKGY